MAAKSYSWSTTLSAAVAPGEEAEVLTPGFENPENYDTDNAEAVWNGTVLTADNSAISFEDDWSHAHVTNNGEATWMAGDTIYVAVAAKAFDPGNVEESFTALEARVAKNETDIADLEARVTALEGAGQTRSHGQASPSPVKRK